ncbi:MAG TPA: S8 family serine peptidase, partial [Cyclobacteriaceae bacterium]
MYRCLSLLLFTFLAVHTTHAQEDERHFKFPEGLGYKNCEDNVVIFKLDNSIAPGSFENPLNINEVENLFSLEICAPIYRSEKVLSASKYLNGIYKIHLKQGDIVETINELLKFDNVLYAEPSYKVELLYVPNDPEANLDTGNQEYLEIVKAYEAWDITRGDTNIVIGISDTGMDLDHEDIQENIFLNHADPVNGIDDDGNGYVDDYIGWDIANNDNHPDDDRVTHGTGVSGVAGATTNNGIGISGIGFYSKIVPIKIFDSGSPFAINPYESIIYAAENGIDVLNLSWGAPNIFENYVQDIINYAVLEQDVVIVASAGNTPEELDFYPASYENVLSIGATDLEDNKTGFSTFGYKVDLVAPGIRIFTTRKNNNYFNSTGTSVSSPQVSGAAALVRDAFPQYNALQVMEQLRVTADDIYSIGDNNQYFGQLGHGRLNIEQAVTNVNAISVRQTNMTYNNGIGELAFYGDQVKINMNFTNYLNPVSDLSINFSTESEFATLQNPSISIGDMQMMGGTAYHTLNILLDDETPPNERIIIKIDYQAVGYEDYEFMEFTTEPNHADLSTASLNTTIAGDGNLGYANDVQTDGVGLTFNAENILSQFGLMIGLSNGVVVDNVVNNFNQQTRDSDFKTIKNIKVDDNGQSDLVAFSSFNPVLDSLDTIMFVEQELLSFVSEDFYILEYRITNTTDKQWDPINLALFSDWQLGDTINNKANWNDELDLGYVSDENIFAGISLLTGQNSLIHALDIGDYHGNEAELDSLLLDTLKHKLLNKEKLLAGVFGDGNDVGIIVGGSIPPIDPYGSEKIAFFVNVEHDLLSLQESAAQARLKYEDYLQNPPVTAKFETCKNDNVILSFEDNQSYSYFKDPLAQELIGSGREFEFGPILNDTIIYFRNSENQYLGAIEALTITAFEANPSISFEDTVFINNEGLAVVNFNDLTEESISWLWDFGDGSSSTIKNPVNVYTATGEYEIDLLVTNVEGCSELVTKDLLVAARSDEPLLEDQEICYGEGALLDAANSDILRVYVDGG